MRYHPNGAHRQACECVQGGLGVLILVLLGAVPVMRGSVVIEQLGGVGWMPEQVS
jgi:hypothetical protein